MSRDNYFYSGKNLVGSQLFSVNDFDNLITPKQRKRIIKKIFYNDQKDYEKFISLIRNISNWKDANILIDFYFCKNGVDPVSREALEFRNIYYHLFSPPDE